MDTMETTRAALEIAPAEIWAQIFEDREHVGPMEHHERLYDYATMAAVSSTCRLFRDIIRPKLYRTVSAFETGRRRPVDLDLFARTLREQPRLAPLVEDVFFHAEDLGPPAQASSWPRGCRLSPPGCSLETAGQIMCMLPRLRAASFCLEPDDRAGGWRPPPPHGSSSSGGGGGGGRPGRCPPRRLPRMPCPPALALKNRHEWGAAVSGDAYPLEAALPLLAGPGAAAALETLVCRYLWSELRAPLSLAGLRSACFFRCEMTGAALRGVLAGSARLESFLWVAARRGCWPHQVAAALAPARRTLRVLGLDFSAMDDTIDGDDDPTSRQPRSAPQVGSLRGFTALTSLYMDTTCVYHPSMATWEPSPPWSYLDDDALVKALPESVQLVVLSRLHCCVGWSWHRTMLMVARLSMVMQDDGDRFPNLQHFHCQGFLEPEAWEPSLGCEIWDEPEFLDYFVSSFASVGVAATLRKEDFEHFDPSCLWDTHFMQRSRIPEFGDEIEESIVSAMCPD